MRITNNMLINNMMLSLSSNLTRTQKYQDQLATGKKISAPSDDPIVASRSLKLRTDVSEIGQYRRNTDDATSWMDITEATMGQITEVVHRLREITVQAANGTNTPDDLHKTQAEADQLKQQLIHLSNATYAGRYIFSGTKTDKPLLNDNGEFKIEVTALGDEIKFEIGTGDDINVNVIGSDLFNGGVDAIAQMQVETATFTPSSLLPNGSYKVDSTGTKLLDATGNQVATIAGKIITLPDSTTDTFVSENITPGDTITINGPNMTLTKESVSGLPNKLFNGTYTVSGTDLLKDGTIIGTVSGTTITFTDTSLGTLDTAAVFGKTAMGSTFTITNTKSSFVDTFDKVINAMNAGDQTALSSLIGDIDDEMGNLLRVRAGMGARMNRVELTSNRLEDDRVNYTALMSKNEDVDIAEAIMNLQNEENVYKASLSTGARVIQPSLVDFLR